MTNNNILRCSECGKIIGILANSNASMVCCGKKMEATLSQKELKDIISPTYIKNYPGVEVKVISQLNFKKNNQAIERVEVQTGGSLFKIFFDTRSHSLSHCEISDL